MWTPTERDSVAGGTTARWEKNGIKNGYHSFEYSLSIYIYRSFLKFELRLSAAI